MCARNKYAHQIGYICHTYQIFDRLVWKMCVHTCAKYEVTAINHVTMGTVHLFDIHHWANMAATLHLYVHFKCTATAWHLQTWHNTHLVPDTNSYKIMGINAKKNMVPKCQLTTAMSYKWTCTHILHVCTYVQNLNLLQPKSWHLVQFKEQWTKKWT